MAVTATRMGMRTLLVDADPLGGGADLLFGWEEEQGLRWRQLAEAGGPIDAQTLVAALPSRGDLVVLACDRPASSSESQVPHHVPPEVMGAALDAGRQGRDLVVVDLPRRLDEAAECALRTADGVDRGSGGAAPRRRPAWRPPRWRTDTSWPWWRGPARAGWARQSRPALGLPLRPDAPEPRSRPRRSSGRTAGATRVAAGQPVPPPGQVMALTWPGPGRSRVVAQDPDVTDVLVNGVQVRVDRGTGLVRPGHARLGRRCAAGSGCPGSAAALTDRPLARPGRRLAARRLPPIATAAARVGRVGCARGRWASCSPTTWPSCWPPSWRRGCPTSSPAGPVRARPHC
jgi:hypothetical protein